MEHNESTPQVSSPSVAAPQPRPISLAEARRKALEDSDRAEQSQIAYAEEEAKRWYDYRVDE